MSEFYVDILDTSGSTIGPGPLTTVEILEDTKRLDAIGEVLFTLPAGDPRTAYLVAGTQFRVYDRVDGYIGKFFYRSKSIRANAVGDAMLAVRADDQLTELTRQSVHFRRTYVFQSVDDVVEDLVGDVSGWSAEVDSGIGDTTVAYEGESVLGALDVLRDRWNQHFRLERESVLGFGAFGDNSGVVLINARGQVQSEIAENKNVALVDQIQLVDEADEVFNRIIPLGAGQGTAQLTIATATLGAYAVQTGTNENASNFYYIENSTSVTAYGRREKVLTFPQIRPITNSAANIINAANALKLSAEAYIARHLIPKVTYAVTVKGLRKAVNVGDLIRLQYRGLVDKYAYIDVDETFYVMDVTRRRSVNGERSAQLVISTLAERRTNDTDIVLDVVRDLRALKINVPITLSRYAQGPYIQRLDDSHTAVFTLRIGAETLYLNYAILRFKNMPLKSSVTSTSEAAEDVGTGGASSESTTASGGSSTPTSAGGSSHSHTITIAANDVASSENASTDESNSSSTSVTSNEDGTVGEHFHNIDHTHTLPHTHEIGHGHTGSTGSSESSHTHSVSVSAHTHGMTHTHSVTVPAHEHELQYGLYEDTAYPTEIYINLNGVTILGPYDPTGIGVEEEIDVTEYLLDTAGGLQQNHHFDFNCGSGQGEIEMEIDLLVSIQAISVS